MRVFKVNYVFNGKSYEANLILFSSNDSIQNMLPAEALIINVTEVK